MAKVAHAHFQCAALAHIRTHIAPWEWQRAQVRFRSAGARICDIWTSICTIALLGTEQGQGWDMHAPTVLSTQATLLVNCLAQNCIVQQ